MIGAERVSPRRRLTQEERSERSRGIILRAALKLFSTVGYHGTTVRDIAEAAKVSTGAVYHQFPDKESIFRSLLDDYFTRVASPEYPLNRALLAGAFPNDMKALARAARESVQKYRPYVALIYVDVVEFDGSHIRRFYSEMADRFAAFLEERGPELKLDQLRDGVRPLTAIMTASRFFLQYFAVEVLFGVEEHFGQDTNAALAEIVNILERGMLKTGGAEGC